VLLCDDGRIGTETRWCFINPYPSNVENMVSSQQCQQMADGI